MSCRPAHVALTRKIPIGRLPIHGGLRDGLRLQRYIFFLYQGLFHDFCVNFADGFGKLVHLSYLVGEFLSNLFIHIMNADTKKSITIDLDQSQYARGFASEQQIHRKELDKAMGLIRNQINALNNKREESTVFLSHNYNTIGVFGDRGTGKTSFMISLLNRCMTELDDAEVMRLIDPTLVEHKKPIILCVISMIQQKVESVLRNAECRATGSAFEQRRTWDKTLAAVARGIFAIDNVGEDYDDSLWQDEAYVMHSGMAKVNDANAFEENLRNMIETALTILDKKAFIIAFDDIDVDVKQGWNVLESLRRYLSDPHIISIVSGNIKLYGSLVRHELGRNLKMPEGEARDTMSNELESQYMLKLLNPARRINLLTLSALMQNDDNTVQVKKEGLEESTLKVAYNKILASYGISDNSSQKNFVGFLLSMSLRSQIHFLNEAWSKPGDNAPMDVFSSRLYASGIDLEALRANPGLINIVLLKYLNSKSKLPDCYLMMPTLPDKDMNSNFTALTLLECQHLKNDPYLTFDFLLRIGYMRNVALPLEDSETVVKLCRYAGWNQQMSMKNNVGLTMAYVVGKGLSNAKEHIQIYALEEKAKRGRDTQQNALDKVLKDEENNLVRLMAMFPFIRVTHAKNNESRSYYSTIVLMAVIGNLLKCGDKDEMAARINDLKLFRSYQMPQDGEYSHSDEGIDGYNYGVEIAQETIAILAESMHRWKEAYKGCHLPPYVLGRIMTRLFSSLPAVTGKTVGAKMNVMVANLFNACLIEETKIRIEAREQGKINNSNLRSDTRYFKDNLGKREIVNQLAFTGWIMSCPMLNCFLDAETYEKLQGYLVYGLNGTSQICSVYNLLCRIAGKEDVDSRSESKPSFSGEKNIGWKRTRDFLNSKGINDDLILKKIIYETDPDKISDYLKSTGHFAYISKGSIVSFKKHFREQTAENDIDYNGTSTTEDENENK